MEPVPRVAPAVLRGRRRYATAWFGVAAFGAAFGFAMVSGGAWAGWTLVLVFVPAAVLLGMNLRPQANELVLDGNGYTIVSMLRRAHTPWKDVDRIGVIDGTREQLVAIRFTPPVSARLADADEIAGAMGGYHRTLPLTYGLPAVDLAALMQRYRGTEWDAARDGEFG